MAEEDFAEIEVPEGQKRSSVWRHPDRDMIHALMARGKSDRWIAEWLDTRYPLEDDHGQPHANAVQNRRLLISAVTIGKYRREWMPECHPGVDVVDSKLEKLIGGVRTPAPAGHQFELDVMEALIAVTQFNLAKAIDQDEQMGMLQPITLEATKAAMDAAARRVDMAQKLSVDGYEKKASEQIIRQQMDIESRNMNVNVNANGAVDPATGELRVQPEEPRKVQVLAELMKRDPAEAREMIRMAKDATGPEPATIEGAAEEE